MRELAFEPPCSTRPLLRTMSRDSTILRRTIKSGSDEGESNLTRLYPLPPCLASRKLHPRQFRSYEEKKFQRKLFTGSGEVLSMVPFYGVNT